MIINKIKIPNVNVAIDVNDARIPALTNNSGKVLAVNSGATGLEWKEAGGDNVFIAQYGVTSAEAICRAWYSGKVIFCRYTNTDISGNYFGPDDESCMLYIPLVDIYNADLEISGYKASFRCTLYGNNGDHDEGSLFDIVASVNDTTWHITATAIDVTTATQQEIDSLFVEQSSEESS